MKSLVVDGTGKHSLVEVPEPEIDDYHALVKMES